MLRVVKKLWERMWGKLWESCEKVLHSFLYTTLNVVSCVKVEKFYNVISTCFGCDFSLFDGWFYTVST